MKAPDSVLRLVDRFDKNLDAYKQGKYNETQVRIEFIDPMFKALGWDVDNVKGYAEAYKDVVHEDAIRVGHAIKAPDYSFRIGGQRKFFLESKKPSVDIKEDIHPAFQLRRYAWSAKLPLSILTDFEELAVYDCRTRPTRTDKASNSRVLYLSFKEYIERWDEIAGIFSREAILKGSFDKYVESKRVRGTAEVDTAFLQEIERWRELLARNIALRNPELTQRETNFAVQRTIDRIIFLRICEDRGIERYGQLMALQNGTQVYPRLFEHFRHADQRYNSGLFHFRKEKDRPGESIDSLTPNLIVDDNVLKDILKHLYYPDSPYEFSVLPADILGQVYEQFLGKVIRLTKGHRAVVEGKPEVKKAGGVYYTPTYIVDYIVKQTVGKLLEGKKPGLRGAVSRLKILDPACGSGSFLLGAFQYLLDWHRDGYVEDGPEKWAKGRNPRLYQGRGGDWRLTTDEKKRILLNNIYGVDIDPQAVEVTKLSLLLKVLEGESEETISAQLSLFRERALPDLGNNIKCGNSLIGADFYEGKQMSLLDEEEIYRINAFDWEAEFPEIMNPPQSPFRKGGSERSKQGDLKKGGFDVVIGNPPYIRIQAMKEWAPLEVEIYKRCYNTARKGNYDIYVVFVEKGLNLLNRSGLLGFILPHKFFNAKYGEALRELVAEGKHLSEIIHFGDQQIFEGATNYTCLLFLDKQARKNFHFVRAHDIIDWQQGLPQMEGNVSSVKATRKEWNFVVGPGATLFDRLSRMNVKLGDVADIFVGLQTSADIVYLMDLVEEGKQTIKLKSEALDAVWTFEKEIVFPIVSGTDVNRYSPLPNRQYIVFPYQVKDEVAALIDFGTLSRHFPKAAKYLLKNKDRLTSRERGKFKGDEWYRFGRNQNIGIQNRIKLCIPRLVTCLQAAYDCDGSHFLDNVDVNGITIKQKFKEQGLSYLLGLINSKLLSWFFPFVSATFRGGWLSANRQFLSQVPIRTIDLSNPTDKALHNQMISLVERMLDIHKQLAKTKDPQTKTILQRQIETTDRKIDQLVYELYDLPDKEIKIVEEGLT